jgi:hypothetical protein
LRKVSTQIMREWYPRYACLIGFDTPLMRESIPAICVEIHQIPQAMGCG